MCQNRIHSCRALVIHSEDQQKRLTSISILLPVRPDQIILAFVVAILAEMVAAVVAHAIESRILLFDVLHVEAPSTTLAAEEIVWMLS